MNKKAWGALAALLVVLIFGLSALFYFTRPRAHPVPSTPPLESHEQEQKPPLEPTTPESPASPPTQPAIETQTPPATPPEVAKPTLIFYVEKSPLPAKWIEAWEQQSGAKIDQRVLPEGGAASLPMDGDVYALSPRFFGTLGSKMKFFKLPNASALTSPHAESATVQEVFLKGVDPAFYGHGFDPDNEYTRPWRWTPYLFFLHPPQSSTQTSAHPPPAVLPNQWWNQPGALFPTDMDLVIAMRLKERPMSIHTHDQRDMWPQVSPEMQQALVGKTASDEAAWEKLKRGEATFALLPASVRLRTPREDPAGLAWFAPAKGTIIQFDLLAISEKSAQTKLALSWLEYLQAEAQQNRLLDDTGYFSVRGSVKEEIKNSPIPLPSGSWFNRSEYLMDEKTPFPHEGALVPPAEPTPASTSTPASTPAPAIVPVPVPASPTEVQNPVGTPTPAQ